MRGEFPQNIERALERLWQSAAKTVPEWLPMRYVSWLPQAYEVASRFEASAKGKSNLYLVLLDYCGSARRRARRVCRDERIHARRALRSA